MELDSNRLILLLIYNMYVFIVDFGSQCITHCGSSRDGKVISPFVVLLYYPDVHQLFFETKIHIIIFFFTILASQPVGYYYVYVVV